MSVPRAKAPAAVGRLLFQDLDLLRAARVLAALVHRSAIRDADLRDRAMRAARSASLTLAEALRDDRVAMRRRRFLCADGSLHETVAAIDLAAAIGALDEGSAAEILGVAARMRGMLRSAPR